MVGPKKQGFWPKIDILKGNHCILRIQGFQLAKNWDYFRNKVVQKLKLEKITIYKKWSPKLIFINDFFVLILSIFDIEN